MSTLRSAVMQHFKEYLKRISDCYEHRLIKLQLSIFEVPFKTFYAAEFVKYLHNRFRILLMNYCISSYINNCKIISCQKSSS